MMKILLPVDGSDYSRAAVEFVVSRLKLVGAKPDIEVLTVQRPLPGLAARALKREAVTSHYADEAEKALRPARTRLQKAGLKPRVHFAVGTPADEIAAAAADSKPDLIVMGSHGHSALRGMLLGSVTHAVLAQTTRPMLILRRRHKAPADPLKVGIAVDGSKYGREAVRFVLKHRDIFGAAPAVTLLHVVADVSGVTVPQMAEVAMPVFSDEEIRAMHKRSFEAAVGPVRKLFDESGLTPTEVCLVGNPGEELASYAKKKKLDVLVMGSHGYGAFKAAVMGSVATRVAASCDVPLLLVRKAA
jgi:nucleotide-binding universal stress UspA family protein